MERKSCGVPPTPDEDLTLLCERIAAIEASARAPFRPDEESRPYQPISASFSDDDWLAVTRVARAVARGHRATLNTFLGEIALARAVVDTIAEPQTFPSQKRSRPVPTTIEELAAQIEEDVDIGDWLVSTPISNCILPDPLIELDDECYVISADQSPDPPRWANGDDPRYELRRRLGEMVDVRPRWLHTDALTHPLDTRMTASVVLAVHCPESVAAQIAQATADYLLAGWMLFAPPGRLRLWPTAGPWAPQPWMQHSVSVKPFRRDNDDPATQRVRTGSIQQYYEYEVPEDLTLLRRPLRAVRMAETHHSARALLSATWAWRHAARGSSALEVTDIMFYAFTCLAALCEDPEAQSDRVMFRRWGALRHNVPGLLQRALDAGLDRDALDHAQRTLQDARNLAAHGSDAVLVNLGYPSTLTRTFKKRQVEGVELGLASLHAALRPSLWLLREALLHCWMVADESDFDDNKFNELFAVSA
jgi:hypothetical protein